MGNTTTVHVDTSKLEKKINALSERTQRIESAIQENSEKVDALTKQITGVSAELQDLADAFQTFINDSRKAAAVQKAATELVRVRQEIEQNFGSYRVVRETMLGVLQATDLALVKKTTISQVTEELMLSTPDYWLAPCLVAVAAWIGNNRDLANRAITEALKRDEEKTALAMALICRRNNRTETCYEWLSLYFAKQSASNFTESNFTYLDAYLNGVFGPDKKHMCDDYAVKWMREIQSNGDDIVAKQTEQWRSYCEKFTVNLDSQFPQLREHAVQYRDIAEYVGRINAVGKIADNFSGMKNVDVDQQKLKKDIDQTLVTLISRCDEKEEPLRKEEQYLLAVRRFDGDTEAAKAAVLEANRKRTEDTINLIDQMTNVIVHSEDYRPSERKTAVSFLSSYIRSGFESYMTEKKEAFPETITLEVEGWTGTAHGEEDAEAKKMDFRAHMEKERLEKLASVQEKNPKQFRTAAIAMGVLGLVFLMIVPFLGILILAGAGYCLWKSKKLAKDTTNHIVEVDADFDKRISQGERQIDAALAEWDAAKKAVKDFESEKLRDVVA